ncbi:hemicentin-1 isoform X2 [Nematostella vectensis]|uniref:hemicentin-1 isoform X2 n=1 Tax=Nematostella vectensis TaxID=45351 RepID=UPI002077657F|nr:hemicentin-1 isoform X2 [Nematostella vectensis]
MWLLLMLSLCASLSNTAGFAWTSVHPSPLVVFLGDNSTDVELRWDFDLQISNIFYARLELLDSADSRTKVHIKNMQPGEMGEWTSSYYLLNVTIPDYDSTSTVGFIKLTIKNMENQGPHINVEAVDTYFYRVKIMTLMGTIFQNDVSFRSFRKPNLLSYPTNHTIAKIGSSVSLECDVKGKPPPNITWSKLGDNQWRSKGSVIRIFNFTVEDRGIYECSAYNGIGPNVTAVSLVQYTGCTSRCAKKEVGVEMTDLKWTVRYSYSCLYTPEINNLKSRIEYEIVREYIEQGVNIFAAQVTHFRRGSVVAVISLQQPINSTVNDAPVQGLVSGGHMAGQEVTRHLVSPTGAAWTKTPQTPLYVLLNKNSTLVNLQWEFDLQLDNLVLVELKLLRTPYRTRTITNITAGQQGEILSNTYYHVTGRAPDKGDVNRVGYVQLIIKDVVKQGHEDWVAGSSDAFTYSLVIRPTSGHNIQSDAQVIVYMEPKLLSYPSNHTITQIGGRLTLTCEVQGIPTPNITWSKLGDPRLRSTGSTFTISGFTVEDRGIYVCTASNGIGPNVTAVSLVQYTGCVTDCTKREVSIQITSLNWSGNYSNPDVYTSEIRKLKNRIEYEIFREYELQSLPLYAVQVTSFRSGSVITNVSLQQPGNSVNFAPLQKLIDGGRLAGQTVRRLIGPQPVRPELVSYPSNYTITQIGSRVTLTCEVRGIPTPNITWSKLGDPRWRSTGSTFTISGFTVEDRGIYVCTASNGIGTNVTAVSLLQYTGCTKDCAKKEVPVHVISLLWTERYSKPDLYTPEIQDLKKTIEYEITRVYQRQNVDIYAAQVTSFKRGSVVAMVTLQQPGDSVNDAPLQGLIDSGKLAGQFVRHVRIAPTTAAKVVGYQFLYSRIFIVCVSTIGVLVIIIIILTVCVCKRRAAIKADRKAGHLSESEIIDMCEELDIPLRANVVFYNTQAQGNERTNMRSPDEITQDNNVVGTNMKFYEPKASSVQANGQNNKNNSNNTQ